MPTFDDETAKATYLPECERLKKVLFLEKGFDICYIRNHPHILGQIFFLREVPQPMKEVYLFCF